MSERFAAAMRAGVIVSVILAVFTVAEYFFATEVSETSVRVTGLFIVAVVKAVLIVVYFMHIKRAWAPEAH